MFSSDTYRLKITAGLAAVAALVLGTMAFGGTAIAGTAAPGIDPITTAAVDAPQPVGDVDMKDVLGPQKLEDRVLGSKDAPVTIVEYFSMTCPHCRDFENKTFPAIKKKYIDSGKVRYIGRLFPLFSPKQDPRGAAASALARCVPADQYYPMIEVLYQQWDNWALPSAEDPKGTLLRIAKLAGLTQKGFQDCLTNQQLVDDIFAERNKAEKDYHIEATPTFLINGKRYEGFMTVDEMSAIIDKLL
ncbi:MAG TPA: DsbA family protein [Pararhizobium sp.]|nr:DsbA family protein [Pararhizobium sp.]